MASIPNIADLQYSGFYIPVFTLAYIYERFTLPVELPLPLIEIVISSGNFGLFFIVALVGALVEHGMSRAIFGPGGPLQNPKNAWVVRWHKMLFLWKSNPGLFPQSLKELEKKFYNTLDRFEEATIVEKGVYLIRTGLRGILFGGAVVLFTTLTFLLTAFLLIEGLAGSLDYIGLILLITQLVFFFGSHVLGRFASVVSPDAARWLFVPEYKKAQMLNDRDEIDFAYDPRGFFDVEPPLINHQSGGLSTETIDRGDYLIPISEDTEYLIKLDEED